MKHLYPSLTTTLMASCVFAPVAIAGGQGGSNLSAVPSHAQPGECYARVKHDAVYAPHSEIVIVEEGYQRLEVDPAVLQSRTEQVLTKEASVRYEVRQPQYSTVTEQMMVRPSYEKLSVSPPQFSTVTETVQVSAPRVVWKRGNPGALAAQGYNVLSTATTGGHSSYSGGYSGYNGAPTSHGGGYNGSTGPKHCGPDCEIWCLVEEPGEAVTYQRKVVSDPGRVERQTVPAKFQTITKQVVSDPGGVREIPIPAEYSSVTVEDIVQMGGERYVNVPPVHGAIETQVFAEPERYEWMRVICSTGQVMGPASQYTPAMPHSSHSAPASYGGSYSSGAPSYTGVEIYSDGGVQSGSVSYDHGAGYSSGYSGIVYGGDVTPYSEQSYSDKQPSALIYGSSNSENPSYGMDYQSSSQPRIYGGEGMNAHHSANTTR